MNDEQSKSCADTQADNPLELAPDQDDDPNVYGTVSMKPKPKSAALVDVNQDTSLDDAPSSPLPAASSAVPGPLVNGAAGGISEVLRWALDSLQEPAMTVADWLARDIDLKHPTAVELLCNPHISMAQVRQAKTVYKTMRVVGEKSADRRVGARLYAAAIAAGLVRHGRLVSRQSKAALARAFQGLLDDRRMPKPLRELGGLGLCALKNMKDTANDASAPLPTPQPKSAFDT